MSPFAGVQAYKDKDLWQAFCYYQTLLRHVSTVTWTIDSTWKINVLALFWQINQPLALPTWALHPIGHLVGSYRSYHRWVRERTICEGHKGWTGKSMVSALTPRDKQQLIKDGKRATEIA